VPIRSAFVVGDGAWDLRGVVPTSISEKAIADLGRGATKHFRDGIEGLGG